MMSFKQKRSGNYSIDHFNPTIKIENKEDLKHFWDNLKGNKIIKATYSRRQTYYNSFESLLKEFEKC